MQPAADQGPEFSPEAWLEMFRRGEHEALCDEFLRVLRYFQTHAFSAVGGDENARFIDTFVESFLTLLTQPQFMIAPRHVWGLIDQNHTIGNLAAISRFGSTDEFLRRLLTPQANLVKVLALYSARNRVDINRQTLFDANADLASRWYTEYAGMFTSVCDPLVAENLRQHFHFQHPGLTASFKVADVQYGSTYVGDDCDRAIKPVMNAAIQRWLDQSVPPVRSRPQKNKIVVLSGMWREGHSIFRMYNGFFEALRGKYDVTFVQLGEREAATSMFDRVVRMPRILEPGDLSPLQECDFQMALYPEIGMQLESIVLCNRRIAPIQVCLLGHPVSTWSATMDYFISGAACEKGDHPERRYSERLVLLPGMGVADEKPVYVRQGRRRQGGRVIINCPWTSQKIHYRLVETLARVMEGVSPPVLFRVFVAGSTKRCNDHLLLQRDLVRALGAGRVELVPEVPYEMYMRAMEEGDFTLNSFPYGGENVISDALYLRLPTITWSGDRWYNQIGAEMARRAGLGECVAHSEEEYVALARRMIEDGPWRSGLHDRLEATDLDATVYSPGEAAHFAAAVDYLIENHERLRAETAAGIREPIRIH